MADTKFGDSKHPRILHSHERLNSHDKQGSSVNVASNNIALTRRQLTIHEVIMTLNLANQASNMRDKGQLVSYLRQARNQLQTLVTDPSSTPKTKLAPILIRHRRQS